MIRAVIDTNVIISGFFWSGTPKKIIEKLGNQEFELYVSMAIIEEYEDLFKRFELKTKQSTSSMLDFLLKNSHIVQPIQLSNQICDDPDDDIFIAAALACNADSLVTGDNLLLACTKRVNLKIIKPREFLEFF